MRWFRHSRRLARIDVQRMLRKHFDWRGDASHLLGVGMYTVTLLAGTFGGGYLGYRIGGLLGRGSPDMEAFTPIELARGLLALFWLVFVAIYVFRTVGQRGSLSEPEGILTVVSTRQALVGVLLAEYVYFLIWLLPPAIGVGVGLSLGTGLIWPSVAVPLGTVVAGIGAVGAGYTLGLTIRHVTSRLAFVAQHKIGLIALGVVAYILALSTGAWNRLVIRLFDPMRRSPIGWYADLLLIGLPDVEPSIRYALGGIALSLVIGALSVAGGHYVADRHWFSDPVRAGGGSPGSASAVGVPAIERGLSGFFGPASASLIALSWRRAKRSPLKLLYAFYPLLLLGGVFGNTVQTGEIPSYLPYVVLLFSAWAAGVIFTLNPLGDQGAVLPVTVLSPVSGRTFVRSLVAAGLIVAIPVGTFATAVAAFLSPLDADRALLLVAGAPVVMILSAAVSVGIGIAFPRFEATNVTRSMKTVLPSPWAFGLFTVYLITTAAAGAVVLEAGIRRLTAALLSMILPFGLELSPVTLDVVATVALVPLLLAPVVGYRYAVRRFDRYTLA